jgi:hypothetical protein
MVAPRWFGDGEIARPKPGKGEILVRVGAAGVTTADWRLRAAAFPGLISAVAGRLMFGIFRPRKTVLGSDFAGTVAEVGPGVTEFAEGDRVFGFQFGGAHAEYMTVKADGAVLKDAGHPDRRGGGGAALRRAVFAGVPRPVRGREAGRAGAGRRCVGRCRGLRGADRQGAGRGGDGCRLGRAGRVGDGARRGSVRRLPRDAARDPDGPYDVVFDTVGALTYPQAAHMLSRGGRFVPLNFGVPTWATCGRRAGTGTRSS